MILNAIRARTTPEQRRIIKFGAVGGSGVAVNLAFVWVGRSFAVDWEPEARDAFASALGIMVSILGNFLLNDFWTWGDRAKGGRTRDFFTRALSYYVVSAAAVVIQYGVAMGLRLSLGWLIYWAQAVGILLGTGVNYVANNRWTFRDQGAAGTPAGEANSASDSESNSGSA
ncbi:MAG: GtrA family protein [Myxococcota bacterium]